MYNTDFVAACSVKVSYIIPPLCLCRRVTATRFWTATGIASWNFPMAT